MPREGTFQGRFPACAGPELGGPSYKEKVTKALEPTDAAGLPSRRGPQAFLVWTELPGWLSSQLALRASL